MATNVKTRFRKFLPGAGFDANGSPVQGKTRVVGRLEVTSYTRGGEPLTPRDIGLTTIDSIDIRVENEVAGPGAEVTREARYSLTDEVFYLTTTDSDGTRLEATGAGTENLQFDAFGDSAHDVELT